ncbi:peptidase inhibitor family I36 protein [Micromonospora fulviviridis]|uniref:peptidase inhibitor family I36 protein n=1 Tax=Micromonospora fulviviridis TaxID=47860 RepID=UPI00379B3D75
MSRRSLKSAVAVAFAAGLLASVTMAAPAQASLSQCSGSPTFDNAFCHWSGTNYTGSFKWWQPGNVGQCRVLAGENRSVYNPSRLLNYQVFSGSNCTGTSRLVTWGTKIPNLGFSAHSLKDLGLG